MKTDPSTSALPMLQAIELFRTKPPIEWTADELAAFRARLELSPTLAAALGGPGDVQRRLAEVETALAAPRTPGDSAAAKANLDPMPSAPASNVLRRTVEATIFLALFVAAGTGFYFFTPRSGSKPSTAAKDEAKPAADINPTAAVSQPSEADDESTDDTVAEPEPLDDHHWKGWSIAADSGQPWTLTEDWDLTDATSPERTRLLTIRGGPVILTRRLSIPETARFLELNFRTLGSTARPGHIHVRIGDAAVADVPIGSGETRWPHYMPLEKWSGKEVAMQVIFAPGEPNQMVACWELEPVDSVRHEPRSESALAEGLAAKDPKARLYALKQIGLGQDLAALPALMETLHDRDVHVRQATVAAMMRFTDPRAREALRAALEGDGDPALRAMIVAGFSKQPRSEDVPALVKAIKDSDPRLRQAVARALGGRKDESVTALLIQTLADSDPAVRGAAAASLARRKGPTVEGAMLKILADEGDPAVKLHAVNYFFDNPTPQAVAPLAALVKSGNEPVKRQSIRALAAISNDAAIDAISAALGDSSPGIRKAAGAALKHSRNPKAAELLKQARPAK